MVLANAMRGDDDLPPYLMARAIEVLAEIDLHDTIDTDFCVSCAKGTVFFEWPALRVSAAIYNPKDTSSTNLEYAVVRSPNFGTHGAERHYPSDASFFPLLVTLLGQTPQ